MSTVNQIIFGAHKCFRKKKKDHILQTSPQKRGVCLRVYTQTPKKPNSALRKVARVQLSNKVRLTAHIPGEGHNLQEYSTVLVHGAKIRDLPGVNYRIIRGCLDALPVDGRKKGRSKYGVKKIVN